MSLLQIFQEQNLLKKFQAFHFLSDFICSIFYDEEKRCVGKKIQVMILPIYSQLLIMPPMFKSLIISFKDIQNPDLKVFHFLKTFLNFIYYICILEEGGGGV